MMGEQKRDGEPQRRRGRPRVSEPRSTVSTWLPAHAHDRLIQIAKREELSISAVVRQLLIFRLK
jgi:hypothetical protein